MTNICLIIERGIYLLFKNIFIDINKNDFSNT